MNEALLRYEVKKLPERIGLAGRILFLADDPVVLEAQLSGTDPAVDWDAVAARGAAALPFPLRDDISTDEITPGWVCYYADETLGRYVYVGLRSGDRFPIRKEGIHGQGFVVAVSGKRRGKGSSREQSPYAERAAGIRVVIAENIERIYRQNCQNLGVLASTDFSLLARIARGEELPLSAFTAGEDEITRQIIEYGGLFSFNVARMQGKASIPPITTPARAMTLAEKIFARHMIVDLARGAVGVPAVQPGDAGFAQTDIRFSHEYVTPMAAAFFEESMGPEGTITDPESVYFFRDHLTFLGQVMTDDKKKMGLLEAAENLARTQESFARKHGIRLHGEIGRGAEGERGSEAICHSKVAQSYALPGQLVIGTDSHTPHSGALGCLAFGVGTTDMFNAWVTKDVRVRVPGSVLINVTGTRPEGVTAKDFMLAILAHPYVKGGSAIGKLVEYAGAAVEELSVDERATMTNMAAEVGAMTGIVRPDEKTARFLEEWRGLSRDEAERLCQGWFSDPDAEWEKVIEIDGSALEPMVALPGDPGNGVPMSTLCRERGSVPIEIAYGGSCTAGKRADMDMYAAVLKEGLARGQKVHERVTFWIQFGSQEVKEYCARMGYLEIFAASGARVIEPSCGACINAGPGVSYARETVTISAINRNFPGRSGPGQMYLASPLTVAASALAGEITAWTPGALAARP
ncbi:MAG: 3-isopropylmalate dehydratase [Candidatus Eisenbacteria bacterium]|nr:3-isopropylmalate dehydratase [Candidatus Eisenbacteria bacterium]